MFPLEFENLVLMVTGLALGWYGCEAWLVLKRRIDKRAAAAHEELKLRHREEVLRLIDLAIEAENDAFGVSEMLILRGRDRKKPFKPGERWELMRKMRNYINRYSAFCGQIEDRIEPESNWQTMLVRRRNKLDPFELPVEKPATAAAAT